MKLFTKIRKRFNKKVAVVASAVVIAIGVIAPIAANAGWGPDRPTYTYGGPGADHVVFNSFVNNPDYGDERAFFDSREASSTGNYQDKITVQPGEELLLRTYVHNNANPSLNGADFSGPGVAHNTKVQIVLPGGTTRALRTTSIISASNASPNPVSDTTDIVSSVPFNISYIPGSARAYTNAVPGGYQVNDSIISGGAQIGYNQADGVVPGCFQYSAFVTIRVRVNGSALNFNKEITQTNNNDPWAKQINANPGDTLSYMLSFNNNGQAALNDVVVRDQLPSQVSLVPGSVILFTPSRPNGIPLDDNSLFSEGGVDVGNYDVGSGGKVRFRVTVKRDPFQACQQYTVTNTGFARSDVVTDQTSSQANFSLYIPGACTPPPPPGPGPGGNMPRTGIETPIAGALGTTGIGYGTYAYVKGKKKFRDALRGLIKK